MTNIFSMSSIMRGSITDLDPGTYKDMYNTTINNIEASGDDGSDGRNLSRNQHLQFIPRASFKCILEAALDCLPQIQNPASAKNLQGEPLAAFCTWQPCTDACVGVVLDLQKEASTKTEQTCDLRSLILETDEQRNLKPEVLAQVIEAWSNNTLPIKGHPKTTVRPFVGKSTEAKLEHNITSVDSSGKLQLAEALLKDFLDNPTTANQADDFLCAWHAQMQGPDAHQCGFQTPNFMTHLCRSLLGSPAVNPCHQSTTLCKSCWQILSLMSVPPRTLQSISRLTKTRNVDPHP